MRSLEKSESEDIGTEESKEAPPSSAPPLSVAGVVEAKVRAGRLKEAILTRNSTVRDHIVSQEAEIKKKLGIVSETRAYAHDSAVPSFDLGVFFEQLFIHLFFPVSTLYARQKYGPQAV